MCEGPGTAPGAQLLPILQPDCVLLTKVCFPLDAQRSEEMKGLIKSPGGADVKGETFIFTFMPNFFLKDNLHRLLVQVSPLERLG